MLVFTKTAKTPRRIGTRSPEKLGFLETVYGIWKATKGKTTYLAAIEPQPGRSRRSCNTETQAYCRVELFELILWILPRHDTDQFLVLQRLPKDRLPCVKRRV